MIELADVTRTYGSHLAVDRLSLRVAGGELFAFLGPNGAGKTTTIKMLVGLLQPTSGSLWICGEDVVADPRASSRRLGYVPDEPHLYEKLSGREFLRFVADLFGMEDPTAGEEIERQIATFRLGGFVDQLAESYSHGMKQRLIFAAALLHQPEVLILDEPMVGLDPRSMRLVKDLLREQSKRGTTVFMSTHTLSLAEEIAHRIGVVDRGKLRFLGTVAELRQQLARHESSLEDLFLQLTEDADAEAADSTPRHEPLFGEW
jgi:ABC-2 type transport system ATP-binding protein